MGLAAFAVGAVGSTLVHADSSKASDSPAALSPKEFREFPVVSTKKLSADSVQVRLALPSSDHVLGMTTCSCLSISAEIDGNTVSKPYTPCSSRDQKGHVDFVVKGYPARTDGQPGGMGRHIQHLKVGDTLKLKGPWKKLEVTPNKYKSIGMVAGGTGLTPMLQVINEVIGNGDDDTKMTLIYGNQ